MRVVLIMLSVVISSISPTVLATASAESREVIGFHPITDRLWFGRATYHIVESEKIVGQSIVEISETDGVLALHDVSTMEPDIAEDALARFDAATFAPLSAFVAGQFGATRLHGTIGADGNALSGQVTTHQADGSGYRSKSVALELPEGATLRAAGIWLAAALGLEPGGRADFAWFSSHTGGLESVVLEATGLEQVTVPAGTFEAVRVTQSGGSPGNVIFVTTEAPHRIVRVTVEGRPMTIDLVRFEPREASSD